MFFHVFSVLGVVTCIYYMYCIGMDSQYTNQQATQTGDREMATTNSNMTFAVEALRDSSAIEPVLVENTDGTFSVTSALNVTDETEIATQEYLTMWIGQRA